MNRQSLGGFIQLKKGVYLAPHIYQAIAAERARKHPGKSYWTREGFCYVIDPDEPIVESLRELIEQKREELLQGFINYFADDEIVVTERGLMQRFRTWITRFLKLESVEDVDVSMEPTVLGRTNKILRRLFKS